MYFFELIWCPKTAPFLIFIKLLCEFIVNYFKFIGNITYPNLK